MSTFSEDAQQYSQSKKGRQQRGYRYFQVDLANHDVSHNSLIIICTIPSTHVTLIWRYIKHTEWSIFSLQ